VREGLLGDVYRINGCIDTDYTPEKRKRLAGRPGGMMFELGCHLLDIVVLMLGAPKKVTPFLRHDVKQDDNLFDNTCAVFDYDTAMVVIESSAMRPNAFPTRRFEVCGTNGCVTVEPHEPPAVRLNLRKARGEFKNDIQEIAVEDHPRHVRDFQDLARCIRGEAKFGYSKQHDLEVLGTLLHASGVNSG
jgi:predicted dehydrogenase